MKNITDLLSTGKNSRNIQSKKTKGVGYHVLGFGAGGAGPPFIVATGGTPCAGTTSGNYKIHTFLGPGTFTVCSVGSLPAHNVVDYLVVAGGGGSGFAQACYQSGGGGGGFLEDEDEGDFRFFFLSGSLEEDFLFFLLLLQ